MAGVTKSIRGDGKRGQDGEKDGKRGFVIYSNHWCYTGQYYNGVILIERAKCKGKERKGNESNSKRKNSMGKERTGEGEEWKEKKRNEEREEERKQNERKGDEMRGDNRKETEKN